MTIKAMTDQEKANIKLLIATYEAVDADWSIALESEVRKYNGSLPDQERRAWFRVKRLGSNTP
jgi:hypothetical protein